MIIKIYSPKCIMSMYRIHSFIVLFFAVLVILKVQVHLYRSNNYWLCGVCINFGSSWVIDRLLLQVLGFGTVFVRTYVLRRAILAFQNSKGILKKTFVFVRLQRFVTCFFCVPCGRCVTCVYKLKYMPLLVFFPFGSNCHNPHPCC